MTIFFLVVIMLLLAFAGVGWWFAYKLATSIFTLEEQIEESLDLIDGYYSRISAIASTPVLSNEPYIVELVQLIVKLRDAVLLVANKLASIDHNDEDEKEDYE